MIRFFYILTIVAFFQHGFGQNLNWFRTYGGQGYDEGFSAVELTDSSFVVVGSTSSFYNSNQNLLFMKVDSAGNFLYSTFIDNGFWETGKKIIQRNEGEFWVCGHTNSIGAGGFDGYLVQLDSLGNKVADFTFGGSDWDFFHDMIMLSDSSLVIVGETQSFGMGNKDAYILKLDKNGDTTWTKTYGTTKDDWASAVIERNDTLYITGAIGTDNGDTTFGLCLGLDLNGNYLFERKLGTAEYQYFNDIHPYSPNDIYLVGTQKVNGEKQVWIEIVSFQGNSIGGQTWVSPGGDDELMATINYPGTFYMLNAMRTNSPTNASFVPSFDIQICKTTPGGWWNYGFIYGFPEDENIYDLIPTSDQGALAIGSNADIAIGGRNTMLIKIGAQDSFPPNQLDSIFPITTAIDELELQSLKFYPNPVQNLLFVFIPDLLKENYHYQILSANGQQIRKDELKSNQLDVQFLMQGLYFIQIWSDQKVYQAKFIKE